MQSAHNEISEELAQVATNDDWPLVLQSLLEKAIATSGTPRYLLGIAGPPGSGKSRLSAELVRWANACFPAAEAAIVVPMDGFHLPNEQLEILGLRHLKGIPESFDAKGFVDLLSRLRTETDPTIYCPRFDRTEEASVPEAIKIQAKHKLIVVEGNYLLLESEPWVQIRSLLDAIWYVDVPWYILEPRLVERHQLALNDGKRARTKVRSTDEPNARLVMSTRARADYLIEQKQNSS